MRRLHLFNPENDIALASGTDNFTAPKAAVELHNAGAVLPIWYADSGDRILAYGVNARWLDNCSELFGIDIDLFDHNSASEYEAAPWGWSAAVRRTFLHEGFSADRLPDENAIKCWRELSHRRTAAKLQSEIVDKLDFEIAPAAVEVDTIDKLRQILEFQPNSILKSPWSSSGRGLIDTRHFRSDDVIRRAEGIIKRQGSIMVEQAYNRRGDFAALFECRDGHCSFVGYSVFKCDNTGNYMGNILANDIYLCHLIDDFYPFERITSAVEAIRNYFDKNIAPLYSGPIGVDMFCANVSSDIYLLNATVEINLRMTMGRVALELSRRYLASDSYGYFSVSPNINQTLVNNNIIIDGKRLISGQMMLTPPGGKFRFVADVTSRNSGR